MWGAEGWHNYCSAPCWTIKASSGIESANLALLYLVVLRASSTRDTFFIGIFFINLVRLVLTRGRSSSSFRLQWFLLCLYRLFHGVQSSRNLAHTCWPRFDQRLRRLCYSGPGSSLFQILTRPACFLFGSSRHVSGVQPAIAYGECSRQVKSVPLSLSSIALIIPSTPSSSGLSLLLLLVTVHEQNLPLIPLFLSSDQRLPVQFVSRLRQVSQRLVRLIFFHSQSPLRNGSSSCELDEASLLLIFWWMAWFLLNRGLGEAFLQDGMLL